ncbi:MAG: hypothetical protein M3132_13410 [Actinomycetia bacterium]|nr:hypothetical protein [Actinomycetes bacterium]
MAPLSQVTVPELAELLTQTGHAHHAAYISTDGTDPEWASWYSGHLQAIVGGGLGRAITRSEIVYLLLKTQKEHEETGSQEAWSTFYARLFLAGA